MNGKNIHSKMKILKIKCTWFYNMFSITQLLQFLIDCSEFFSTDGFSSEILSGNLSLIIGSTSNWSVKNARYLCFLFSSSLLTTDYEFQPTDAHKSPKEQNGLWFLSLINLIASGMTYLFLVSYGDGTPSNTFNLSNAAAPLFDLY